MGSPASDAEVRANRDTAVSVRWSVAGRHHPRSGFVGVREDGDHLAAEELASAPGLDLSVHLDVLTGDQFGRLGPAVDQPRQLEELAELDWVAAPARPGSDPWLPMIAPSPPLRRAVSMCCRETPSSRHVR